MYVTIALNAYGNRRRGRSWLWLGRAVAAWPPQLLDARFVGAAARSLLGGAVLSRIRLVASG
jgi:hypothetical protein